MDYASLSREQLIGLIETNAAPTPKVKTPLRMSPYLDGQTAYIDNPNPRDLEIINHLASDNSTAEKWRVWPFLASDNFLNYNYRTWGLNTLGQMDAKYAGAPLILNHTHDVSSSVGFIFDAQLYRDDAVPSHILNASIFGAQNSTIADREGYQWLLLKSAVEVGSPFDQAALKRRAQACSTSFWLYDSKTICPDCSHREGRQVEFSESEEKMDAKGRKSRSYTCPHTPISLLNKAMWEYFKDEDMEEPLWSSWTQKDGNVSIVENSSVVSGALPAAGILREMVRAKS